MTAHDGPPEAAVPEQADAPPAIISTGISGLDTVLGGGIPIGSLLLIIGTPGTGKTLLAQQLCFNLAENGFGSALYFSTLSEPHDKLVRQLIPFRFYKPERLSESVVLLALQEFLSQGLEVIAETIVRTARQRQVRLVCIDGLRAIEDISQSDINVRQFLYHLSSRLHLLGVTTLVTLERDARDREDYGAYAVADGVLVCYHDLVGVRLQRKIEVKKLRAMAHLSGMHSYRITTDGWLVFPRVETLIPFETSAMAMLNKAERLSFGVPKLDRLFGDGLAVGSMTLILGASGLGKTLLCLQYLNEGLRQGEPTLFLSFDERREQLLEQADSFGLALAPALEADLLHIRTFAPVEVDPDEISTVIRQEIGARGVRRVVIDGALSLERATTYESREYDYFAALATYLHDMGVTLCVTREIADLDAAELNVHAIPLSIVAQNLLLLRQVKRGKRCLSLLTILKMRDGEPDRNVYEYEVGPDGFVVNGRFETVIDTLDRSDSTGPSSHSGIAS